VRILLNRNDVNPNTADFCNRGPVFWAIRNKHERVVQILLGQEGVNPDTAGAGCRRRQLGQHAASLRQPTDRILEDVGYRPTPHSTSLSAPELPRLRPWDESLGEIGSFRLSNIWE